MNTQELFLKARVLCEMSVNEFLFCVGEAVRMLLTRYPTSLICAEENCTIKAPDSLADTIGIHPLYDEALLLGAVAMKTKSENDRIAFLKEAECAYRALWRKAARRATTIGGGR